MENIIIHKAETRGNTNLGWLNSYHTFSFGNYYNPDRINFGVLRVLNDDIIKGGRGFDEHPHNNMEIISIPIYGALAHKDNLGNEYIITENDIQVMSDGSGILHSEYNANEDSDANFLQIWLITKERNLKPRYEHRNFEPHLRKNNLQLIVSPDGRNNSNKIYQNAFLYLSDLDKNLKIQFSKNINENLVYIFIIDGNVKIENHILNRRDAIGLIDIHSIEIISIENSKIILFEIPNIIVK